jgi:hypothetical protein
MFRQVKALCGVPPVTPVLTPEVIEQARADAQTILDGLDDDIEEEPIEDEFDVQSFREACRRADASQRRKPIDVLIERLRRLMEPDVTLERPWHETNHPWRAEGRAAESTVEAIKVAVRARGAAALEEPPTQERLRRCDRAAVAEIDRWLSKNGITR